MCPICSTCSAVIEIQRCTRRQVDDKPYRLNQSSSKHNSHRPVRGPLAVDTNILPDLSLYLPRHLTIQATAPYCFELVLL